MTVKLKSRERKALSKYYKQQEEYLLERWLNGDAECKAKLDKVSSRLSELGC